MRWLLSSDWHIPFHNKRYLDLWFQAIKWWQPDIVDYVGDISDQDCYSRFSDGRTSEFLNQFKAIELSNRLPIVVEQEKSVKEFYQQTRQMLPNAELFSSLGNHDVRVFDYADKKMPDILEAITPDALWDFKNLGIDYIHYSDPPKHRYSDIYVHHGMAISKHSGESVKADVDTFGVSIVRGHSHRMGSYFKYYELRDETLRGYEIGHNTDIKSKGMSYTNNHSWNPGFAYAHIDENGYPHMQLAHISKDFTVCIDGKIFKA